MYIIVIDMFWRSMVSWRSCDWLWCWSGSRCQQRRWWVRIDCHYCRWAHRRWIYWRRWRWRRLCQVCVLCADFNRHSWHCEPVKAKFQHCVGLACQELVDVVYFKFVPKLLLLSSLFTKQATKMRRSTIVSLPLQFALTLWPKIV
jgi:hypothetical protein